MENNIFLSWSGKLSNAIAYAFHQYLPIVIQNSKSFFSQESLTKDSDWFNRIQKELYHVKTGIIFLTKENINSEWIILESGGLLSKGSICVLLCDIDISYLKANNSFFQYLNVTKLNDHADLFKLFKTLKGIISPDVNDEVIQKTFDKFYNDLKEVIENSIERVVGEIPDISVFTKLIGSWKLSYTKLDRSFKGEETLHIDHDGKYFLVSSGSGQKKYYFQLNVLDSNEKDVVWQKVQIIDEKVTNMVHSIEKLSFHNDNKLLMGSDTLGYELTYIKIE